MLSFIFASQSTLFFNFHKLIETTFIVQCLLYLGLFQFFCFFFVSVQFLFSCFAVCSGFTSLLKKSTQDRIYRKAWQLEFHLQHRPLYPFLISIILLCYFIFIPFPLSNTDIYGWLFHWLSQSFQEESLFYSVTASFCIFLLFTLYCTIRIDISRHSAWNLECYNYAEEKVKERNRTSKLPLSSKQSIVDSFKHATKHLELFSEDEKLIVLSCSYSKAKKLHSNFPGRCMITMETDDAPGNGYYSYTKEKSHMRNNNFYFAFHDENTLRSILNYEFKYHSQIGSDFTKVFHFFQQYITNEPNNPAVILVKAPNYYLTEISFNEEPASSIIKIFTQKELDNIIKKKPDTLICMLFFDK